jgi:hypothetical protein
MSTVGRLRPLNAASDAPQQTHYNAPSFWPSCIVSISCSQNEGRLVFRCGEGPLLYPGASLTAYLPLCPYSIVHPMPILLVPEPLPLAKLVDPVGVCLASLLYLLSVWIFSG